jgi:hypothetical protein
LPDRLRMGVSWWVGLGAAGLAYATASRWLTSLQRLTSLQSSTLTTTTVPR